MILIEAHVRFRRTHVSKAGPGFESTAPPQASRACLLGVRQILSCQRPALRKWRHTHAPSGGTVWGRLGRMSPAGRISRWFKFIHAGAQMVSDVRNRSWLTAER